MRRYSLPLVIALACAGSALPAQDAHFGFGLNLVLPTGGFRSTTYAPTADVKVPQEEGYDLGLGGQFTISFPVDPKLAVRLNMSASGADGTNTAAGYEKINLRHQIFSVGGEMQIFTQSAARHKGTYFLAGVCADFERFDRSFGSLDHDYYWDETDTTRKSRLGATVGIGHSFGYDFGRFTIEASLHKTISGNNTNNGEPPSTDFVKMSFGWVF